MLCWSSALSFSEHFSVCVSAPLESLEVTNFLGILREFSLQSPTAQAISALDTFTNSHKLLNIMEWDFEIVSECKSVRSLSQLSNDISIYSMLSSLNFILMPFVFIYKVCLHIFWIKLKLLRRKTRSDNNPHWKQSSKIIWIIYWREHRNFSCSSHAFSWNKSSLLMLKASFFINFWAHKAIFRFA